MIEREMQQKKFWKIEHSTKDEEKKLADLFQDEVNQFLIWFEVKE